MEITRNEVRVMTVHGAKGLEAPIVILADTTTPPAGPPQRQPRLLALPPDGAPGAPERFVWAGPKATDFALVTTARERARRETEDEYRRLLYVAMTRAIDRLIVCGAEGERGRPEGCWWDLVSAALQPVSVEEPADDGDGKVWRYRKTPQLALDRRPAKCGLGGARRDASGLARARGAPPRRRRSCRCRPRAPTTKPRWSARGRRAAARHARRRSPAATSCTGCCSRCPTFRARRAPRRRDGIWRATAKTFQRRGMRADARAGAAACSRIRASPSCSRAGSRAEVPIVGRLTHDGRTHRGVRPGRPPGRHRRRGPDRRLQDESPGARGASTTCPAYVAQLALYRAVLGQLYPGKAIRAALVWTDVPDLMEVSAAALDQALAASHLAVKPP